MNRPRTPSARLLTCLAGTWLAASTALATEPPAGGLTLPAAVRRTLEHHPALAAAASGVDAALERQVQAGLWPNPELEVEAENFGGSGELAGFDASELTAVLSQPLPVGGRVAAGRDLAGAAADAARTDLEASRLEVSARTRSRFYGALLAQERVSLASELLELTQTLARTVTLRVEAGKVSPVEGAKARIEVARARARSVRAHHELAAARELLVAMWGGTAAEVGDLVPPEPLVVAPPAADLLLADLTATVEMRRLEHEVRQRELAVRLARAEAIPDLAVSVGARQLRDLGEEAWVAGLAMAVPIFDRGRPARRAAELELEQSRHRTQARRLELAAELEAARERLAALTDELYGLDRDIVPAAEEVHAAAEIGYREGKLGFLDVLDAQRTLVEARVQRLDVLAHYLEARTALELRLGRSLTTETLP
jgi:cobalt-zinc-cadmium efflux system outer membrane protein